MTSPVALTPEIDAALQQMLLLSEEQRLYLSDRLAESVECMDDELAATVSRRIAELDESRVEAIPAEQVYQKAREHLRAIRGLSHGSSTDGAMSPNLMPLLSELEDAFEKMLELRPEQRLFLRDMLASSVPQPLGEGWNREIERRIESLDNGTARTIPADEVFRRLWDQLRAKGEVSAESEEGMI